MHKIAKDYFAACREATERQDRVGTVVAFRVITVDLIERAIVTTITAMSRHDLPLLPVLQRLEAERDRLIATGSPADYAKRLMARINQRRLAA